MNKKEKIKFTKSYLSVFIVAFTFVVIAFNNFSIFTNSALGLASFIGLLSLWWF